MEENAYITSIAASLFYLVAGVRLFRLNRRTQELPELLLSMFFVLSGIYYVSYNFPDLVGSDGWSTNVYQAINWTYLLGVVPYLFFIRALFRPDSTWAVVVVVFCLALMTVGGVVSVLIGYDSDSLASPWFLAQWAGYTLPCVWLLCEAVVSRKSAAKRARIGLCPPAVANRYLLLALFAAFQVVACLADLSFAQAAGNDEAVSMFADVLLGTAEIASISVLWLAFLPPKFYSDWIKQSDPAAPSSGAAG